MPDIAQISKAIDFVEDNLREAITVADMADAASYSLYHFCRTFNGATHHTPYDYLMRRRLSESARDLLQTDGKIIDIALNYRFNSHETFSRAFKRMFGLQPNRLRKQGSIDKRRLMPRLTRAHIRHISKGPYLRPVLEKKEDLQVAGVMTLVKDDRTVISELWKVLSRELETKEPAVAPKSYYGITHYPQDWEERGLLYMAAYEIPEPDTVDTALVIKTVPALEYARFIHKGPRSEVPLTLDYVYHTWVPKSDRNLSYRLVVEHYGQGFKDLDHEEAETEIYIPIEG